MKTDLNFLFLISSISYSKYLPQRQSKQVSQSEESHSTRLSLSVIFSLDQTSFSSLLSFSNTKTSIRNKHILKQYWSVAHDLYSEPLSSQKVSNPQSKIEKLHISLSFYHYCTHWLKRLISRTNEINNLFRIINSIVARSKTKIIIWVHLRPVLTKCCPKWCQGIVKKGFEFVFELFALCISILHAF